MPSKKPDDQIGHIYQGALFCTGCVTSLVMEDNGISTHSLGPSNSDFGGVGDAFDTVAQILGFWLVPDSEVDSEVFPVGVERSSWIAAVAKCGECGEDLLA